jgi:hypothetical protein
MTTSEQDALLRSVEETLRENRAALEEAVRRRAEREAENRRSRADVERARSGLRRAGLLRKTA